ncbi:MAG: hypothetical protein ACRDWE_08785 [Acidimicrobiales bacterium]
MNILLSGSDGILGTLRVIPDVAAQVVTANPGRRGILRAAWLDGLGVIA